MKYYLDMPNNIDAFPPEYRECFRGKYDVAKRIKYKPNLFNNDGAIDYIIAGREGQAESYSYKAECIYHKGKYDLFTLNGLLVVGGFDYFVFHSDKFILYWNTKSYDVDGGVYAGYKRILSTSWYDFSAAVCLVLTLDFNTFVNHFGTEPISPRGIFKDKIELIERIGFEHLLEGYVSTCRQYVVSDFYIKDKDVSFIDNIKEHNALNMATPYKLLSFVEEGKIVSSHLFQDLQAPQYNNNQYDFLVVINDKVGVFSKEGYRVSPIYDFGYSDNCHYSLILTQNGKKWYWDVDYKTYKITEGKYDFHLRYMEESLKDSMLSKDSLAQVDADIKRQCEYAQLIKEHPELRKEPKYEPYEWTEEDTWDAMTDGMYGDYPGCGFDYEVLGF